MFMDIERAQAILKQEGIDVLLSTRPENLIYVTGFYGNLEAGYYRHQTTYALIFREQPPVMVVPWWEVFVMRDRSEVETIPDLVWGEPPSVENPTVTLQGTTEGTVAKLISEHHLSTRRIGIDEKALSLSSYRKLQEQMPDATFVDATRVWEEIRLIKTPAEISRIEKSVQAVASGYEALRANLREGVTEREIHLKAREAMQAAGGNDVYFQYVASGVRNGWDHVVAGDFEIPAGEIVKCDMGTHYDGYCSDVARTFACGEPSPEQAQINKRIVTTVERIMAAAKPEVPVSELYRIYLDGMREGYGDLPWHIVGHSIGLEVHETFWISPSEHRPLQAGMVISVEIGYLDPGRQGQLVEENFLITEGGYRRFTPLQFGI
jgi:Xaa-Pro aminopeptidase